jgi:energy-coupling factor transporter ATP-binding protein EcfA2
MHLSLTNFLCHDKLELDIPAKSIVLLKGERGKGKSSIIKSIAWVLYGNIKKVTPFKSPNVKTTVILTMDNLEITRTKKPNKLTLLQNNIVYDNQEAQKKIDNLFGTYDMWLATSYIIQKKENLFLTTSNAEKMDILNTIAFHDELPSVYIHMIEKSLEKHKHLQEIKSSLFHKKLTQFHEEDLQLLSNILQDPEEVQKSLINAKETLNHLFTVKKQRDIAIAIKNSKEEELQHLHNELIMLNKDITYTLTYNDKKLQHDIEFPTEEGILYIKSVINDLDIMNTQINRKKELDILIQSIDTIHNKMVTEEDYIMAKKQEEQYYYNDNILKMYELDHDEEQVNDCIEYFRTILSSQETLLLDQQLTEQRNKMMHLQTQLDMIHDKLQLLDNQEDMVTLTNTTNLMQQELIVCEQQLRDWNVKIECPHCSGEVLCRDGKWIIFNNNTNDMILREKITTMNNIIIQNKLKINNYHQEYDSLMTEKNEIAPLIKTIKNNIETIVITLASLPKAIYFKILNPNEKEKTYESIAKLKSIVIITLPPISSTIIQNTLKYKLYKDEYDSLPNHLYSYQEDIITLKTIVTHLDRKISKLSHVQSQINKLGSQIQNIIIVNDPEQQITTIENNINYIENSLINHKKALKIMAEHEILTIERNEVLQLTQKVEDLTTLKQYAIDIECKVLGDIVASINMSLHAICTSLFDDLILELCLYKTLKNKNEDTKPCVHFTVYYKGCVYDNVNSLSVGELDQVSLAIALAFHKLSPNSFIMYDEISANLNGEHKNMNINAIREHTNCIVLYVQHDGTDGVFDHIIDIEQYT